jgi:hypothetical protein
LLSIGLENARQELKLMQDAVNQLSKDDIMIIEEIPKAAKIVTEDKEKQEV